MNAPHPGSAIALTPKYFPMTFFYLFVKPYVVIDGHVIPGTDWNRMVIPVPPGQHHVYVHSPGTIPPAVGKAQLSVVVAPGQVVEMEYRSPLWGWSPGSLGPPPQKYNGGLALGLILGFLFLLVLCICAVPLLNS